jgi:hypothetical protein
MDLDTLHLHLSLIWIAILMIGAGWLLFSLGTFG